MDKLPQKKAEKTAKETFETGGLGSGLPEIKIKISEISKGLSILDFFTNNKITSSKNEARRAILNKGIKIDNLPVSDVKKFLEFRRF